MKSIRGAWMLAGAIALHLGFVACGGGEGSAAAGGGGGAGSVDAGPDGGACDCPASKVEASIAVCTKDPMTLSTTAEHDYPGLPAQDLAARVKAVVPIDFNGLTLAGAPLPLRFGDGKVVAQCDGDSQTIIFLLRQ